MVVHSLWGAGGLGFGLGWWVSGLVFSNWFWFLLQSSAYRWRGLIAICNKQWFRWLTRGHNLVLLRLLLSLSLSLSTQNLNHHSRIGDNTVN